MHLPSFAGLPVGTRCLARTRSATLPMRSVSLHGVHRSPIMMTWRRLAAAHGMVPAARLPVIIERSGTGIRDVGLLHQGGPTLVSLSVEGFDEGCWCDLGLQIGPDRRDHPYVFFRTTSMIYRWAFRHAPGRTRRQSLD